MPQAAVDSRKRIRLILLLAFLIALGVLAFGRFSSYHQLTALRDRGAETVGSVTTVNSGRHSLGYTFVAFGRTFSGNDTETPGDGSPPLSSLGAGASVPVIFDPADPSVSIVGNPEARIISLEAGIAISVGVAFAIGLIGLYAYFFAGGRRGLASWQ